MTGAQDKDACADSAGNLPLQIGKYHPIPLGQNVPGRLGLPRGVCHAIEKRARANGLLRGSENPALSCWQILRQEFFYNLGCQVKKSSRVYFESIEASKRRIVLCISCRLADIRRERCYIDEGRNPRVFPCLGDDGACVTVPNKYYGALLLVDSTDHGIYIIHECAQGILNGDDAYP